MEEKKQTLEKSEKSKKKIEEKTSKEGDEITEEKIIEPIEVKEKRQIGPGEEAEFIPKTKLGKLVKEGKIKDIDEIIDKKIKILEPEIVDLLLKLESDFLFIGQFKGKFGGGKRRAWRQTQKKTAEGNIPTFVCAAVVGDKSGHVGLGFGKARETLPARSKAIRDAKLNIIRIIRGCGSFNCSCNGEHSVPLKVEGKCGSSRIMLMPAPQGTGIVAGGEIKKILTLAGIKDVYSKTFGQTRTTINLAKACIEALKKTNLK